MDEALDWREVPHPGSSAGAADGLRFPAAAWAGGWGVRQGCSEVTLRGQESWGWALWGTGPGSEDSLLPTKGDRRPETAFGPGSGAWTQLGPLLINMINDIIPLQLGFLICRPGDPCPAGRPPCRVRGSGTVQTLRLVDATLRPGSASFRGPGDPSLTCPMGTERGGGMLTGVPL